MCSKEKISLYPKTEHFEIVDTIGVPHPYCITEKHVVHAADHYCGRLGLDAIKDMEKKYGKSCGVKGCNLPYEGHEQALLVNCKSEDKELLGAYLKSIVDQCERDGFAGFALMLDKDQKPAKG